MSSPPVFRVGRKTTHLERFKVLGQNLLEFPRQFYKVLNPQGFGPKGEDIP